AGDFLFVHRRVGADDEQVADMGATGRRTIEGDRAGATRRLDDVGGKALAVVDVVELDVLELFHVGRIHQVFIDATGPFVVQDGFGDGGAVQLGTQHVALHG